MKDKGLKQLLLTVQQDSPDAVCKKMLGVIGEHALVQYEKAKSSDDDDVLICASEGKYMGKKRNGQSMKGT